MRHIKLIPTVILLPLVLWHCATTPVTEPVAQPAADPNIDRCFSLVEAGNYTSALPACEAAATNNPDSFIAHVSYAKALGHTGDVSAAETEYRRAIAIDSESIQAYEGLGDLLLDAGDSSRALEAFREVEKRKSDYPANLLKIAGALKTMSRYSDAETYYRKVIALQPDNETVYIEAADMLAKAGRRTKAAALMDEALAAMPGSLNLRFTYGTFLRKWKRYSAAAVQFRKVRTVKPGYRDVDYILADTLFRAERISEAESALAAFLRRKPRSGKGYVLQGRIRREKGDDAGAEKSFRLAVKNDAGNGTAWVLLGNLLKKSGRRKEAIEAYRQALRINPGDRVAKKNLKRLAGGRGL